MTWFSFSILSVFVLAVAELTQQHLLNKKKAFSERTSAVLTFLFQSFLAFPFVLFFGKISQIFSVFTMAVFPKVLLVTFLSSVSMIFYLRSFKVRNISISAIFVSFSAVVSTFLGIIAFGESLSYLKFLGIGLILVALSVIRYKNSVLEKNHFYGLAAGLVFGVLYTLDKSITLDVHPLIYIFWAFMLVAAWGFILGSKEVINSLKDKDFVAYKPIMVSGAAYFLYNFFTFTAYRYGGEVGRIDAINNSQVFLIILFEYFVLKHTKGTARKLISAGLAVFGIFLLRLAD